MTSFYPTSSSHFILFHFIALLFVSLQMWFCLCILSFTSRPVLWTVHTSQTVNIVYGVLRSTYLHLNFILYGSGREILTKVVRINAYNNMINVVLSVDFYRSTPSLPKFCKKKPRFKNNSHYINKRRPGRWVERRKGRRREKKRKGLGSFIELTACKKRSSCVWCLLITRKEVEEAWCSRGTEVSVVIVRIVQSLQYCTMQYCTMQYSTVRCSMVGATGHRGAQCISLSMIRGCLSKCSVDK